MELVILQTRRIQNQYYKQNILRQSGRELKKIYHFRICRYIVYLNVPKLNKAIYDNHSRKNFYFEEGG